MIKVIVALLFIATVAGQQLECRDVDPEDSFSCDIQVAQGGCNFPWSNLIDKKTGKLSYCLKSCNLCDKFDLSMIDWSEVESVSIVNVCKKANNPVACSEGMNISTIALEKDVESAMTDEIATITEEVGDKQVADAAMAAIEAVATAIAEAMSNVPIKGVTTDENTYAFGIAESSAAAISKGAAETYSLVITEAGGEFTELEASSIATDLQKALTLAAVDLAISGRGSDATVREDAYAKAVKETLLNPTTQVFAEIAKKVDPFIDEDVIKQQNEPDQVTPQETCYFWCNNSPPNGMTCKEVVEDGECFDDENEGYCECDCAKCSVDSQTAVAAFVGVITSMDSEQILSGLVEAFSAGAAGVDTVAKAMVEVVVQGNSDAIVAFIKEAFGAQNVPASAILETITLGIKKGGQNSDKVVQAVADGFAQAASSGDTQAFAQAISEAFTYHEPGSDTDQAITQAIEATITNQECEPIAKVLTDAQAIADTEKNGDAFASALARSDVISKCLSDQATGESTSDIVTVTATDIVTVSETSSSDDVTESETTTTTASDVVPETTTTVADEAAVTTVQEAESYAGAIAAAMTERQVPIAVQAITAAVQEGRASAVAEGFAYALGEGASSSVVAGVIAQAMQSSDQDIISAIVGALSSADKTHPQALAGALVYGLVVGGYKATAVSSAITEVIINKGCSGLQNSLEATQEPLPEDVTGVAPGVADKFNKFLPYLAKKCLGRSGVAAKAIATAIAAGNYDDVEKIAEETFADYDLDGVVIGLVDAISGGADCNTVSVALARVAPVAERTGLQNMFYRSVSDVPTVSECVGKGISACRAKVAEECCIQDHPEECACSPGGRDCKAKINEDQTIPILGLYVYTASNRPCRC